MKARVLYATDGRPPAVAAGELLRRLADPERVAVTILHADEFGNRNVADLYAKCVLDEAQRAIASAGLEATIVRMNDDPVACIEKLAANEDYTLIVAGAGNHMWLGHHIFGGVSTLLVHHSMKPTLVVRWPPGREHDRVSVLIGTDGSPSVMAAIETLTAITSPHLADVWVDAVVEMPEIAVVPHPGGAYVTPQALERMLTEGRAHARCTVSETIEQLRRRGFDARGTTGHGFPGAVLLEEADRIHADLVVVGARGLAPLARLAVGSVSAHVARHAPATLIAHADAHEHEERGPLGTEADSPGRTEA